MQTRTVTAAYCSNEEFESFMKPVGIAMIGHIWHKYKKCVKFEDFSQEAQETIARALASHDTNRVDVKVETFVYGCVENCMKMIIRRRTAQKRIPHRMKYSFETLQGQEQWKAIEQKENTYLDNENGETKNEECKEDFLCITDISSDEKEHEMEEAANRALRKDRLWKAIRAAQLSAEEMSVIQGVLNELTQKEIAQQLRTSQSSISKIYVIAIAKVKKTLSPMAIRA